MTVLLWLLRQLQKQVMQAGIKRLDLTELLGTCIVEFSIHLYYVT